MSVAVETTQERIQRLERALAEYRAYIEVLEAKLKSD